MSAIPVHMIEESVDSIKQILTIKTDLKEVGPAVLVPVEDNDDKVILNSYHTGGDVVVKMKVITFPAKKFNKGDKIAYAVLL